MSRIEELEQKVTHLMEVAIADGEIPCANMMVLH